MATPTACAWVRGLVHRELPLVGLAYHSGYLAFVGIGRYPYHFIHTGWPVFMRVRVFVGVWVCARAREDEQDTGACRGHILRVWLTRILRPYEAVLGLFLG